MRKVLLIISVLVLVLTSCSSKKENDEKANDNSNSIEKKIATSKKISESGEIKGHGYVDLGLPSGRLWATCNVGTNNPTEYGEYYAWGETKSKKEYSWANYNFIEDSYKSLKDTSAMSDGLNKYTIPDEVEVEWCKGKFIGDRKTILESIDDAATANWGDEWRMPTLKEQHELIEGCDWFWTDNLNGSGKAGKIGTSKKNGNTIFLPAAGLRYGAALYYAGDYGYYWSSSLYENYSYSAYYLYFDSDYIDWSYNYRYSGQSVRAVVR